MGLLWTTEPKPLEQSIKYIMNLNTKNSLINFINMVEEYLHNAIDSDPEYHDDCMIICQEAKNALESDETIL